MKKIFTLLVSLGTLTTVFAQQGEGRYSQRDNSNVSYQSRSNNQSSYGRSANTVDYGRYTNQSNNRGFNDRQRQEEMDRINHDYDNRISGYRNDRSLNAYDRNRRIEMTERERSDKLKSFGGGVILGGILGVILGSHL